MKLRYITCSDAREQLPPDAAIKLLSDFPIAELAIQTHPTKMSVSMPRRKWFDELLRNVRNNPKKLNLAVHVNLDWCNLFCRGIIAPDLLDLFFLTQTDGTPVIKRWQINIHGSKTPLFQADNIARIIANYPDREYIFQYASSEYNRIRRLDQTGVKFSVLYDASGGQGKAPRNWRAPWNPNIPQGYSGGISPDNVAGNLDKIARVVSDRESIWIDAEGKLKNPETRLFDINRAREYISNALAWSKNNTK